MKKRIKVIVAVLSIFITSVTILTSVATRPVSADDTSMSSTVVKWLFAQYYNCIQNPGPQETIKADDSSNVGKNLSQIIFPNDSVKYPLPSKNVFGVGESEISCSATLEGVGGKLDGIIQEGGMSWNVKLSDLASNDSILKKLGYIVTDEDKVVTMSIKMIKQTFKSSPKLDRDLVKEEDFTLQGDSTTASGVTLRIREGTLGQLSPVVVDKTGDMGGLFIFTVKESPTQRLIIEADKSLLTSVGNIFKRIEIKGWDNPVEIPFGNSIEEFKENLVTKLSPEALIVDKVKGLGLIYIERDKYTFSNDTQTIVEEVPGSTYYFPTADKKSSATHSMQELGHPIDSIALTQDERYSLYYRYLEAVFGSLDPVTNSNIIRCSNTNGYTKVPLKSGGQWVNYYISTNNVDLGEEFNDFRAENGTATFTTITLDGILKWMAAYGASAGAKDSDTCTAPDEQESYDTTVIDPNNDVEVNCFNAAGSLGWILCPVIEFAQHTINAVYGSIVENFLEFRATWLDFNNEESGGKKVYTAWQTFQSFANVVFVVVLLVVIFSQLTGVGIDNLGIKRVLPKLIIAAVLINLSYLICMLFVDISNILGVGVNGIFSNIVVTISESGSSTTGAQILTTVVTGAVAGAVGFLALNPVSVGIVGSVVVVPLVLGLIATLIGILFFFILLGARQAAIIMLVVVSPIAFACYMLPNTKTIFDKWLKIFEALLLLFPICGLMMGGSAFASKVLQTVDNGFLGQLIAMLVGVVPFFFIPTLLRGAFSAMGNLGAKISGVGQNISRGLGRAAANSDTMKDFQTRMRAGVDRNGNLTWAGRKRGEIARGESRLSRIPGMERMARRANARSTAEYMKYQQEMSRQNRLNDPGYRERFERSQEMALEKEQFATEMDIVNDQTNKGNLAGKTYDIFNSALGEYNAASTDEERKAASFKMKATAEVAGGDSYKAKDFIKRMKEDSTNGKLSGDALQAVAKQISTGDNRKNYRATDALGFEYMSQIANGDSSAKNADGSYKTYEQWASDANNVHQALENHVAESNDLMNQSTDSLSEIYRRVRDNGLVTSKVGKNGETIQINDRQTIANLARAAELKSQSGTGKEDVTKNPYISSIKGLAPESGNNADMQPGQSYDTRDLDDGGNAAF